jgi:O-antigen/teichoic acid export membrane protein
MVEKPSLISRFKAELVGQIISVIVGALLIIILARILSSENYGLLFLAISIFSVAEIFSKLGISKSAARYITEYNNKRPDQVLHIISTAVIYLFISTSIVIIILLFFRDQIATVAGDPELSPLLILGPIFLLFASLMDFCRTLLQSFEKIKYASMVNAINQISRFTFALGFVFFGYGVFGAIGGYIIGYFIATFFGSIILLRHIVDSYSSLSTIEDGLREKLLKYMVPLTATSTANVLDKRVDIILVGAFLGPVSVGYYVVSKQIVQFLESPVGALGFALSPTYGSEKASGNIKKAGQIYKSALSNTLLLYIPAAAGIFLLAEPTIHLIFGEDYSGATPILQVLSLLIILRSITGITSSSLDYLGRARARALAKGVTSILNVFLNILLIPQMGVVGAAIATVITYSIYTFSNVYVIFDELKISVMPVVAQIIPIVSSTILMVLGILPLIKFVNGFSTLMFVILVGVLIWLTSSFLLGTINREKIHTIMNS